MRRFINIIGGTIVLAVAMSVLGCEKEVPVITPPEIDEWESRSVIAGDYKVYDTLGNYLYDMHITRVKYSTNAIADSLRFENFDNEFSFTVEQYKWSNRLMRVNICGHDTLFDSNNKRWKLWGGYDDYNTFKNDTIRLRFQKTNINYWVEDAVPYYACDCKQIAVKQH